MRTILYVEDDALLAHVYGSALSGAGFQVEVAEDGVDASKRLFKAKPDLVVLDLMIPKLAGVDVIKFIRSKPTLKDIPVIVVSDASIADQGVAATMLGVQRVFLKANCSPAILIDAINELLGWETPSGSQPAG